MSKMGTSLQKGKKRSLLVISLVMAIIMAFTCTIGASAADAYYSGWGTFRVQVLGQSSSTVTGSMRTSTAAEVNLQAQKVFYGYSFSNVKAIQIISNDIYTGSPVQMKADIAQKEAKYWTSSTTATGSVWTYKGKSNITRGTFNDIMAKFTLHFNEDAGVSSDKVTIKVRAFSSSEDFSDKKRIPAGGSSKNGEYSCDIIFYAFAQGALDMESATVDYKSENAKAMGDKGVYDVLYEDYAPVGTDNNLSIDCEDQNQGRVGVDMYITDVGGGSTATFGYQIKNASVPWTATTTVYPQGEDLVFPLYDSEGKLNWIETEYEYTDYYGDTYTYPALCQDYANAMEWTRKYGGYWSDEPDYATDAEGNTIYDAEGNTIDVSKYRYYYIGTPIPGKIDLTKWDTETPLHLTIDGVDAGSAQTIRGYVQTDDGANNYKYTEDLTVQYQKPAINSFTSVQEGATYGSDDVVSLGYMLGFSDRNKVGQEYLGTDGNTYTGPALKVDVYFTDKLNQQAAGENDNSKWYKLDKLSKTYSLQTGENIKTSLEASNLNYYLPTSMSQVYTGGSESPIDSNACAFKLVVTDLNTGYSVDSYSPKFTIDSSAPTGLEINARKDGEKFPLINESDATQVPDEVKTVGGKGAQVKVYIGNAQDGDNGSGIKEYRYRMYYLASKDVPTKYTTTKEVMEFLNAATPDTVGTGDYVNVQFTDWTPAEDATELRDDDGDGVFTEEKLDNRGQVSVAKDGYYRVDAKAIDNAGHETGETGAEPIPHGFFQVDLTAPSTPEVRLVTIDSSKLTDDYVVDPADFVPYDNRTYSDVPVWLFAYSKPITGKKIEQFMYSTDGGLNWQNFNAATPAAGKTGPVKVIDIENAYSDTPKQITAYSDATCTTQKDFTYQAGVSLTGVGLFDYKSILVKAIDTLGNESLPSEEAVIRVSVGAIHTTATMSHEPIEVALSIGDTDMDSGTLTPNLKNAAAKKINDKFFGPVDETSNATIQAQQNPKADNFNPLALLYNQTDKSGKLIRHQCSWEAVGSVGDAMKDDISCSGECHYDNCPYKTYGDQYSYYLPEYVNVSGLSSASASQNLDGWRAYDLNDYTSGTGKNPNTGKPYTYGPNEEGMVYYMAMGPGESRQEYYPGEISGGNGYRARCKMRGRHIVDITHARIPTGYTGAGNYLDPNYGNGLDQYGNRRSAMSTLLFLGHGSQPFQHFLFLPNDNPTKKTIQFSLNMNIIDTHTWYHSGFLFNSTIRKNASGVYVLSGYRIMASTTYNQVILESITNMPITTSSLQSGGNVKGSGYYSQMAAVSYPTTWKEEGVNTAITNFQLICDGTKVKVKYTKGAGNCTAAAFAQKGEWMFADPNNKEDGARVFECPRPTVDGVRIGEGKWEGDRDCYGFGPYTGHTSHGCDSETSVIYSDMAMTLTVSRSLSEVVTEPQWGNGKAKFIANIDDNAVEDFNDPVLSSQIQWRLNNDKARYIGWGVAKNKQDTVDFLERISGVTSTDADYAKQLARTGMYEENDNKAREVQIDEVATYITTQYYDEFGFDGTEGSGTVQSQLQSSTSAKGVNYDLSNISSLDLSVTPEEYNTTTANADYPAGRWWMTHDITGYDTTRDPKAEKSSDALETGITRPGRYAYYFAPDMTAAKAGKLDPATAVFDFVVSRKPVSVFAASVKRDLVTPSPSPAATVDPTADPTEAPAATPTPAPSYGPMYIELEDMSYDPDCVSGPVWYDNKNQKEIGVKQLAFENGIGSITKTDDGNGNDVYTGTLTKAEEEDVREIAEANEDLVMLNGVEKVEWRWELLSKTARKNEDGSPALDDKKNQLYDLKVVDSIAWTTNSFSGTTLEDLVGAANMQNGALKENNVLTVYQRVTDTAAKRVAVKGDDGSITFRYEPTNGLVSSISQANVTTENGATYTITYPPLSSLSLDKTELFDTAENAAENNTVTVTRGSSQPQGQDFAVSWAVDLGSDYAPSDSSSYIPLELDAKGNYIIKSLKKKNASGVRTEIATNVLVLQQVTAPTVTGNLGDSGYSYTDAAGKTVNVTSNTVTSTGGKWTIPYEFIQKYVPVGKNMVLQITEKSFGYSAEDVSKYTAGGTAPTKKYIQDQSARAIQYKTDSTAPTAQVVTTSQSGGTSTDGSYQASSYLDVSDGKSNVTIEVGGSVDNQGQLGGYGYYFYDTKPNTTINAPDHERAWYYMDADGALQNASSISYGVISDVTTGKIYTADKSADTTPNKSDPSKWTWTDAAGNPVTVTSKSTTVPQKSLALPDDFTLQNDQTEITLKDGQKLTLDETTGKWKDAAGNVWKIASTEVTLDESAGIYTASGLHLIKNANGHWVNEANQAEEWSIIDGIATSATISTPARSVTLSVAPTASSTTANTADGMVFTKDAATGKWYDKAGNQWAINPNGKDTNASMVASSAQMSGIVQSAKEAVAAQNTVNPIGPEGGKIVIGKDVMNEDREPAYSVNVGIFAYDNATGKDTLTGANQTTMSRVENIKLSTSKPMPPEIEVTNDSTQIVAHIGNDGGFRGDDLDDSDDEQTSATSNIANSGVTVAFHPRQAKFKYNNETGAYEADETGTQTFTEDIYKKADLTGITNVKYTVLYRQYATDAYAVYTDGTDTLRNVVAASSTRLLFQEEGEYQIIARIVNGASTESEPRIVHFIIDKTPPTEMSIRLVDENLKNYNQLDWTKSVTLEVNNSMDTNTGANAKYMVSLDDGKTWDDIYFDKDGQRIYKSDPDFSDKLASTVAMSGSLNTTLTVPITLGGTHTVRVKARDEVGNEQELYFLNGNDKTVSNAIIVKVDGEAPHTPKPKLEAKADSKPLYTSYLAKLDYQEATGKIVAQLEDGTINTLDRQVSVPTDENVKLFFFPAEGRKLGKITVKGKEVYDGVKDPQTVLYYDKTIEYNGVTGAYYIELTKLRDDCTVNALFPSATEEETPAVVSEAKVASDMVFAAVPMMRAAVYATQRETVEVLTAAAESGPASESEPASTESEPVSEGEPAATAEGTGEGAGEGTGEGGGSEEPVTPDPVQQWTVYANAGPDGEIEPSGETTVNEGDPYTVTLVPYEGYGVSLFTINDVDYTDQLVALDGNKYKYTIDSIMGDTYFYAEFYELPKRYMKLSSNDLGTLELETSDAVKLMEDGTYEVPAGGDIIFVATPKDGTNYVLKSLTIDGAEQLTEDKTGDPIRIPYKVPEGDKNTILNVAAVFEVNGAVDSTSFKVSVTDDNMGTITPSGTEIKIPNGSARTFTVDTVPGYTIDTVDVTYMTYDGIPQVNHPDITVINDRRSTFEVGVPENGYPADEANSVVVSFKKKTFKVTISTGSYKLHDEEGTEYKFTTVSDTQGARQVAEVPEGVKLIITPVVKDGYKVKNMGIIYVSGGHSVDLGAVSEYKIENGVHSDITLNCSTEQRLVDRMQSAHSITVSAEGVYDINDILAAKPYRFRISDGKTEGVWTEWMDTYVYKFFGINTGTDEIPLEPNKKYTVYVQTKDRVGNESTPVPNSVYTMANMPMLTGANSVNTVGVSTTKSVAIHLDTNQNPIGTEYMAYVATSSDMSNMQPTEWLELDSNGDLVVPGLTPGSKYWLQVVARNEEGFSTSLDNNIISITLSPASPESYTLYFEEPAYPGAPVRLTWDTPDADVQEIELYRDGYLMGTVRAGTTSYDDTAKLPGDHIVVYSYAYVNSSGAGSSQTAVSKEYYDPMKIVRAANKRDEAEKEEAEATPTPSPETPPEADTPAPVAEADATPTPAPSPAATPFPYTDAEVEAAKTRVAELNTAKTAAHGHDVYSETMLYPVFPMKLNMDPKAGKVRAGASGSSTDGENSGAITVYMTYDVQKMQRYQKYYLTLKAYNFTEENGVVTEGAEETDWTQWDTTGKYHNSDGTQIPVETKAANANGAKAEWEKLNTRYVYKVFVQKIESVGRRVSGTFDGYSGQNSDGVEYTLGKYYYVDKSGYGYNYRLDAATAANLETKYTAWSSSSLSMAQYAKATEGTGDWDKPIHDGFIKFNASPEVLLAADRYAGNDPEKCPDGSYIVVDQSMVDAEGNSDMTFKLNVAAWDKDGGTSYEVSAKLGGTQVVGTTGEVEGSLHTTKANADAAPYTVTLDAKGLPTGVYNSVTLYATDGNTTVEKEIKNIKVVVNRSMPKVSSGSAGIRKIETMEDYPKDTIKITSSLSNDATMERQNPVRLTVMAQQYKDLFGSNLIGDLRTNLIERRATPYYGNALKLLTEEEKADTTYVKASGGLTEEGLQKVISRVSPPVKAYFKITKEQYDAYAQNANHAKALRKEVAATGATEFYWIEQEYALNNNLCTWLRNSGTDNKSVQVIGAPGEYYVELVANFGGNETSQVVIVDVMQAPSALVETNPNFGWNDTALELEFNYCLTKKKVHEEINRYYEKGCITEEAKNQLMLDNPVDGPAARLLDEEGNLIEIPENVTTWAELPDETKQLVAKMQVFTMNDTEATISNNYIEGKIDVELGVYDRFDELGVYLALDKDFDPNKGDDLTNVTYVPAAHDLGHDKYDRDGTFTFSAGGLPEGTTYYLWSCYRVKDKDGNVTREGFSKSFAALTTAEGFPLTRYGFEQQKYEVYEKDLANQEKTFNYEAKRSGSTATEADLKFTLTYYQADEFGNLILDDDKNPIEVDADHIAAAKKTVRLSGDDDKDGSIIVHVQGGYPAPVSLVINDTKEKQGHMIVRLSLSVARQIEGATAPKNGAGYTDIFVQDDESPVQTFLIDVYQGKDPANPLLEEVMDSVNKNEIDHYFHKYNGLPVNYTSNTDVLDVIYQNGGTGNLENITAAVYQDKAGTKESSDFFITLSPTQTSLSASGELADMTGKVSVALADGKEDGVYEGWLFLTADHVTEDDVVKIHLYQVVGQSTLSGRIYVTAGQPEVKNRTGIAKVSLYDDMTYGYWNGTFSREPLYTTETDEYGYYTIPNILNKGSKKKDGGISSGKYYIVVERDGFITYNSAYYIRDNVFGAGTAANNTSLEIGEQSETFEFTLRLLGGDVDRDQSINNVDLTDLIECYNKFLNETMTLAEGEPVDPAVEEENEKIRLCDFNGDGVVNVLDRAFLIGNIGTTGASYRNDYVKLAPQGK